MSEQNTLSISELQQQANKSNLRQEREDLEAWMFIHKLQQANDGDVQAQIDLACCYSSYLLWRLSEITQMGYEKARALDNLLRGMNQSRERAFEWLKKSAGLCDEAQYLLGHCDLQSDNALQNDALAFEWLKKAAEQNCIEAQYLLSDCYLQSKGVEHNSALAFEWLKKAAEQNYAKAKYGMAYCYLIGEIVKQNEALAFAWFKSAFEQQKQQELQNQQAEFLYWLACCAFEGNNVEQNETLAFECFKKTAGQGITEVEYRLAHCYFEGKGVEKNYQLGMKWIIRAARKGHVEANNWLNSAYLSLAIPSCLSDKEDAEQYYKFAADWCLKEVDGQNADGAYLLLGILYYSGKGVEQSDERASDCLKKGLNAWGDLYHGDAINLLAIESIQLYLGNGLAQGKFKSDVIYDADGCFNVNDYIGINDLNDAQAVVEGLISMTSNEDIKYTNNHKVFLILLSVAIYKKAGEYNLAKEFIIEVFDKDENLDKNFKAICLTDIEQEQELAEKNKRLELEIKEKENANHRMQKLVEQFTHSLGNVIFPDTIYQVVERLKTNPECRKDVLLLNEAYHSEIIIKLQGELLRQRYANTNPEKFRQFIRSCRRTLNDADNSKSIEDILDYAASRVTARFLNQHYAGLNSMRDNILSKKNVRLDALKQKFEDDILLNKSLRPIAWVNQNLRPIQITEISPLWKKVFILSESHAEALLFGYFSEILFNAFKYADHDKDEFLTLVFDEKNIDDKTYLTCSWQNPVKDKSPSMLGTGKGLDAIQEDLKQLNDTAYPEESLLISQQKNQFQVTLFFKKDLLVNELPSLKIKRKANVE